MGIRHYDRDTCIWTLRWKGVRQMELRSFKCSHFCHIGIKCWGMLDFLGAMVLRSKPRPKKIRVEPIPRSEFEGKRCVVCKGRAFLFRSGGKGEGVYLCERKRCDYRWRVSNGFFDITKVPGLAQ